MQGSKFDNKEYLLNIMKSSFNEIVFEVFNSQNNIKWDDDFKNWILLKLNILLKNQFLNDLYIEKDDKIEWLLTTRTYDFSIKSKKLNRIVLVINLQKIFTNTNKTYYSTYKDIIFNTVNLWTKNIPYYSLVITSLNTMNEKWQNEIFSAKNLLRTFNWNKAWNINWLTKLILIDGDLKSPNFNIVNDTNTFIKNKQICHALNTWVILPDIKLFFSDIYNILQKYN